MRAIRSNTISTEAFSLFEYMYKHRDATDVYTNTIGVAAEQVGINSRNAKTMSTVTGEIKDSGLARFIARRGWKLDLAQAKGVTIREIDAYVSEMLDSETATSRTATPIVDLTQGDELNGPHDFSGLDDTYGDAVQPQVRRDASPEAVDALSALDQVEGRDLADGLARYFFNRFEELVKLEDRGAPEALSAFASELEEERAKWEAREADFSQQLADLTAARDAAVREARDAAEAKERLERQVAQLMKDMGGVQSSDDVLAAARKLFPAGSDLR